MRKWYRYVGLLACAGVAFALLVGCHKSEKREVKMHEEQRAGEVHEERPGEMVVE
jgi:hypothetical protein